MEFNEVLKTRRSIRKYDTAKKVTKEQIEEIISSAILAPSWKNSQTARYYAAIDDEAVAKVAACLPEMNKSKSEGAALVVTTFVKNIAGFDREGNPDNECGNGWGYYDLGLHNENMVLKAAEMGLGTLIMGIRDGEKIQEILNIPDTEQVVAVIAVGYPDVNPEMPKRKYPSDIITWVK